MMRRQCLDCGAVIDRGSRCRSCQAGRERVKNLRRPGSARSELSQATKARDGYRCMLCGRPGTAHNRLEAHHRIPIAEGGPNELWNMITLCHECHLRIHQGAG